MVHEFIAFSLVLLSIPIAFVGPSRGFRVCVSVGGPVSKDYIAFRESSPAAWSAKCLNWNSESPDPSEANQNPPPTGTSGQNLHPKSSLDFSFEGGTANDTKW